MNLHFRIPFQDQSVCESLPRKQHGTSLFLSKGLSPYHLMPLLIPTLPQIESRMYTIHPNKIIEIGCNLRYTTKYFMCPIVMHGKEKSENKFLQASPNSVTIIHKRGNKNSHHHKAQKLTKKFHIYQRERENAGKFTLNTCIYTGKKRQIAARIENQNKIIISSTKHRKKKNTNSITY